MGIESLTNLSDPVNWVIYISVTVAFFIYLSRDVTKENPKQDEEEDDDEEEEDKKICDGCKKEVDDLGDCSECGLEYCEDCVVEFEEAEIYICKNCINKVYPREKEIVEKIVEREKEEPTTEEYNIDEKEFDKEW